MLQKLNMSETFYLLIYNSDQSPCKTQLQFHHILCISNYRKPMYIQYSRKSYRENKEVQRVLRFGVGGIWKDNSMRIKPFIHKHWCTYEVPGCMPDS